MTTSAAPDGIDDRLARRNALILSLAQALSGGNAAVIFATGGIVGAMLAPDRALATLPITVYVLGLWAGTLPVGYLSKHVGRRLTFQIGAACGVVMGLLGCVAVLRGSFAIFLCATFFGGLYAAAHQAYRFAAADTASESFRPRAISWVFAGGLFAAFVGPQLVILTKDLWQPYLFAASFLAQAGVAVLAAIVLGFVRIPKPPTHSVEGAGRSLAEISRQPRFIAAVVCGVVSYAMMNLVMTSAPLAMVDCQLTVTDAALGLQWHILAMYGPSFVTGSLIARFGPSAIVAAGLVLTGFAALMGLAGITLWHFWIGLTLLGLGWNFGFIGATAMVTQCYRPHERNKVQAFNDFLVFGSMALGSFASGKMLATLGWGAVNLVVFPFLAIAAALLLWLALARHPRPA